MTLENDCLQKFQEIEENHLKQMKEFLSTYIELLQSNHDMVGQVHLEFKRQYLEMPVDKLLEQFVLSKYTGLEKPGKFAIAHFALCSPECHPTPPITAGPMPCSLFDACASCSEIRARLNAAPFFEFPKSKSNVTHSHTHTHTHTHHTLISLTTNLQTLPN